MVILVFFLVLPLFFLSLLQKLRLNRNISLPPGPRGLPLIGNLLQLGNSTSLHRCLWQLSQKYGPLMSLQLGFRPTLVVSSAKMAKEVMKTQDLIFSSRPTLVSQRKMSYDNLDLAFAPSNDSWREMRKISVIHLFSSSRVQQFRPIREEEVSRMIENISKSSVASKPINLSLLITTLTNTLICRVAFGKRFEESIVGNRFGRLLDETEAMLVGFFWSDYFPFMGWVDRFTGMHTSLEKIFKEMDEVYQELIDDHLDPNRPRSEQEDTLDIFLQILRNRELKVELSWNQIKAMLMNIFVAGTNTSAATIIWVMTFLMKNPIAMKKAQEEVRNLTGTKGFVNEDDIPSLHYLKAIVKETLRLQPALPSLLPRETTQKCNIGGYEVPAKTLVYVNAWAIGRDPEAWDNTEEFNPDRFIGNSIDLKGKDFELTPFGAGRRICPGISMGILNVELALANLLYKFDWKMPAGMKKEDLDFDEFPGLTVRKKNALYLVCENYI
ncbi:p450 domain-containing protein [Cephalotus follicularis]|uniref:p450 domain-containing protein n=1 Tax=Cephalotus follicularis TaxID=3775 RepID=A0A1Q3C4F6_CEPFO|nr:p450 domain-containing protein [Cephalotus follicularis]